MSGQTRALQAIVVLCAVTLLLGCASGSRQRRGKLSGAVAKASDENEDDRKVSTKPPPSDPFADDEEDNVPLATGLALGLLEGDTLAAPDAPPLSPISAPEPQETWRLGALGGSGFMKGEQYFGLNHFALCLAVAASERVWVEGRAGVSYAPIQETSTLGHSLDGGVTLFQAGIHGKFYTTKSHTFMGQYFHVGLDWTHMTWSYENAITANVYDDEGDVVGTEEIESDGMSGYDLSAGLGWNVVQTAGFQVGGELTPGVILWSPYTREGFDNDVFDPFFYIRVSAMLRFNLRI